MSSNMGLGASLPAAAAPVGETPTGDRRWLLLYQWALTLVERTKRLLGRDGGAGFVVVPSTLALLRLLDLEQIHVVDLAAVLADAALAEQLVVGGHRLHLGHHGGAIGIAFELVHRLEVVQHRRVHASLDHGWHVAFVGGGELLGKG